MGTGYTRNDTSNNIADGNVINAADLDGEFDAVESAFNSSTGHTHDGTSAEGAPIEVLGPSQDVVITASVMRPKTTNTVDLGTSSLKFKDLYIDGAAYIDGLAADILTATDKKIQFRDTAIFINSSGDGQLDIDADTTIELNSPEVIVTDDFRLKSDSAILTFGADNDVTVTHVADTGLDAQAASGFVLKLQTGDTTIESGNTLGKISFNAPDEASGTDAILVGAEIEAAAEATFSSTVNSTALVFKTNDSAAATERVRIKSDGDVVFTGASANMIWDTSDDSLDFADSAKASFGSDADLIITHSGSAGSITNATGDLTLDVEGDIVLDANGADVIFKDDGTAIGKITNNSNNFEIHSSVSDADILFIGNDGGTPVTALTFDMSDGGKATFASGAETAFQGATTITTGDNNAQLTLISTDADANDGPLLVLNRNSSTPTDDDKLGQIQFLGEDDADNSTIFSSIVNQIKDASNGSESGRMSFNLISAGSDRTFVNMTHDSTQAEVVVNEDSIDMDFRVESNDKTHMLFVDGANNRIGINNNAPATSFHITETTAPAIFRLHRSGATNAADAVLGQLEFFNADGSSDGPNVTAKITGSTHGASGQGGNLRFFTHDGTEGGEGSDPVERVRFSGNGNVGIGITAPLHLFDARVSATGAIPTNHAIGVTDSNDNYIGFMNTSDSATYSGIALHTRTTGAARWLIANEWQATYKGDLVFRARDGGTSGAEIMRMDSDGHIGIGTSAPTEALHIASSAADDARIRFDDTDAPRNNFIGLLGDADQLAIAADEANAGADSHLAFRVDASEAMRITADGSIGINTTSPDATLHIVDIGSTHPAILIGGGSGTEGDIAVPHDESLQIGHWNSTSNSFTKRLEIDSAGSTQIGGIETSSTHPFMVKSNSDHLAITIEENSGSETWSLGVDAAGDLGFHNSGSTTAAVTIQDDNQVGIGTTAPTSSLHISQPADDNTGGLQIRNNADSSSIFIYQDGTHTQYDSGSSGDQNFRAGSAERFSVNNDGCVTVSENGYNLSSGGSNCPANNLTVSPASTTTGAANCARVAIVSSTSASTPAGTSYAGISFGARGGLTASWNDDVIARIDCLDFRAGTTSNEDGGVAFYVSNSSTNQFFAGGFSNLGGFRVDGSVADTANEDLFVGDGLTVTGALSKGSGSFKIPHPIKPHTHHLVHSFIEGPQADNIYRGRATLVDGTASINIDTEAGMTDGTFVLLNRDVQCFTSNETGWTAVKGSVSGNTLTITAQDNACTDTVSWMVIGERQDDVIYDSSLTDTNGKIIVEPMREIDGMKVGA